MPNPENIEKHKMKPGETLNPNGRPKGARSMKTILREALELLVEVPNNEMIKQWSKENKLPIKEVLVLKELSEALKGNDKAKQRVWEYVEGKPDQKQQIDANVVNISNILNELEK